MCGTVLCSCNDGGLCRNPDYSRVPGEDIMQVTNDMGLIVWDDLDDPYSHDELAANWIKVDDHDHTGPPNNGKQIPQGGLAPDSVTDLELAPDSVTTVEIRNHTILGEDIADGAIGANQLDQNLFSALVPLGSVIPWYRPNPSFPVPYGWELCDGGTLAPPNHDWDGAGTVNIPDLTDRFIIGAGGGVAERATGGSNSHTWDHVHTIPNHTHNIDSHTHTVNQHQHGVDGHAHSISQDGVHRHTFCGGYATGTRGLEDYQHLGSHTSRQALYVYTFNSGNEEGADAPMDPKGGHAHGGWTG